MPELGDVPLAGEIVQKADDRQMLDLLTSGTAFGRNFAAAPGTPPARVEALRRAFDETMRDPAVVAEAAMMQADILPRSGADLQALMARVYATPKPVVERLKRLLASAGN